MPYENDALDDWANRYADEDGMELVNSAQYHSGLNKLWHAMRDENGNVETRGLDVFTLAAEAMEERNDLRNNLDAARGLVIFDEPVYRNTKEMEPVIRRPGV